MEDRRSECIAFLLILKLLETNNSDDDMRSELKGPETK